MATRDLRASFGTGQTAELRSWWTRFVHTVQKTLNDAGHQAVIFEAPNWEFTPRLVDFYGADIALVPHRIKAQFLGTQTPILFYMQMYCRWLFTLDAGGWGASATHYGSNEWRSVEPAGAFEEYRQLLVGEGKSKFDQPDAMVIEGDRNGAGLPDDYLFFPCQIPHDETLLFHSTVQELPVIASLAHWANETETHVVFKGHPANVTSMAPLRDAAPQSEYVIWADGPVHDLIAGSTAVVTVNSGVGFEALFHGKQVFVYGYTPYDAVAYRLLPSSHIVPGKPSIEDYRRWAEWYTRRVGIDFTDTNLDARLTRLVSEIEAAAAKQVAAA